MKGILIFIFILNSALGIAQQAEFKFKDKTQRLGKIQEGDVVTMLFEFTNSGDIPLIINDYKVACTCTKVILPEEPILPGKQGQIKVLFDSTGKIAYQDRTIELYSNTAKSPDKIRFTLSVINKE